MANFNNDVGLIPSFPINIEKKPKINTITFGDGMEQRLTEGLNQNPRKLPLVFKNITESESDTLIAFLDQRIINGDSFDYLPPNDTTGKFYIEGSYKKTINYANRATVNVTFREVFEA